MCDKNEKKVQNVEQKIPVNLPKYAESTLKSYTKAELVELICKHQTIAEEWSKTYFNAIKTCNAKYDKAIDSVRESNKLLKDGNYVLDKMKKELEAKNNLCKTMEENYANYLRKIKNLGITLCIMTIIAIILFFLVIL